MRSEDRLHVEELLRSAAEPARASIGFRKRVLRAARRAEKERAAQRRVRWSLCLGGAVALLAAGVGPFVSFRPSAAEVSGRVPSAASSANGQPAAPEWELIESYERERSVQAGMMHRMR
jgi:hypothetical protein